MGVSNHLQVLGWSSKNILSQKRPEIFRSFKVKADAWWWNHGIPHRYFLGEDWLYLIWWFLLFKHFCASMWHVCFWNKSHMSFGEHTMEKKHLDLMWLQNQRMMLFKCMVQLDTSVHLCCLVSFRLSFWCFDVIISEGRDLQVACFRPRRTWKGYLFVLLFRIFIYCNGFLYI